MAAKRTAAQRGRTNKAKGKMGERTVKQFLVACGWTLADSETQGLAGDDLFAECPTELQACMPTLPAVRPTRWYSIEVKHTVAPSIAWIKQAKTQAINRAAAVLEQSADPRSMVSRLGIKFDKNDWLLIWIPSGWFNASQALIVYSTGRSLRFALWDIAKDNT